MSRIGKMPIAVPAGVKVNISGANVTVSGPKGELKRSFNPDMAISLDEGKLKVARPNDDRQFRAYHGLTRTLLANMVEGVTKGYEKQLEIVGVGYRAETKPYGVLLTVGYSHPVEFKAPAGITITAEQPTVVKVKGSDKELVGRVAAEIRAVRPPEPYKGKGIRYTGEHVRRKAGKTGAGATAKA